MKGPIFIFGLPRSGTTWVGKLFDSHPDTLYRHEPERSRKLRVPPFPEIEDAPQYREELKQFVAALPFARAPSVVGKQPLFPKSYQTRAGLLAYRASVLAAKVVGRSGMHCPCIYRPAKDLSGRARIVWKSVVSSGRLGVCARAWPAARAIHVMRHPCARIASVLRGEAAHRFRQATPAADDHWVLQALLATRAGAARRLRLADLKASTPEERLAWRWVLTEEKILADVATRANVRVIRYEDVCAAPMAATRDLFEFAGLDWSAQTERFVRASTHAARSGYYTVFKDAREAASRWRSELAPDVVERVGRILEGSSLRRYYARTVTGTNVPVHAMSGSAP